MDVKSVMFCCQIIIDIYPMVQVQVIYYFNIITALYAYAYRAT